jgi:hypothetical protein
MKACHHPRAGARAKGLDGNLKKGDPCEHRLIRFSNLRVVAAPRTYQSMMKALRKLRKKYPQRSMGPRTPSRAIFCVWGIQTESICGTPTELMKYWAW